MKDLLGMIPGVGKQIKDIDINEDAFKGIEAMINSMTPAEREDPDLIDMSRKKRIAKGAGKDISEVNAFMKQFEQMRDMMKGMNKMGMFVGKNDAGNEEMKAPSRSRRRDHHRTALTYSIILFL